jgi:hypothetical protein
MGGGMIHHDIYVPTGFGLDNDTQELRSVFHDTL